jgi:hypothetical protein
MALWRDIQAQADNTAAFSPRTQELLDRIAKQNRAGVNPQTGTLVPLSPATKVEDLTALKSSLRRDARAAMSGANPNPDAARVVRQLANTIDNTMERLGVPGVKDANAATRRYYDVYGRTIAQDLFRTNPAGRPIVRPEQAAEHALRSESPMGQALNVRDYQAATTDPQAALRALEVEQRSQAGRALVDPTSGAVNPRTAASALQREAPVYDQFPGLRGDIQSAANATQTAGQATERAQTVAQTTGKLQAKLGSPQSPYGRVLTNAEDPGRVLDNILSGSNPNPLQDLNRLMVVAKKSPDGIEGFKATFGRWATAGGTPEETARRLLQPIGAQGPTVLQFMKQRGLVSTTDYAKIKAQSDRILAATTARSNAAAKAVDMEARVPDAYDFAARTVGANIGGMFGRGTGAPLVAAGQGSRIARKALEGLGGSSQARMVENAMLGQDGRSLQQLLEAYQARKGISVNAAGQPITPLPFLLRPGAQSSAAQQYVGGPSAPRRRSAYD